jgi:hypothetical protein
MKIPTDLELLEMVHRAERLVDSDVGFEDMLAHDVLWLVEVVRKAKAGGRLRLQ